MDDVVDLTPVTVLPAQAERCDTSTFEAFSGVSLTSPAAIERKRRRPFVEALNRAIIQDEGKRLRAAAEKLLDNAAAGDLASQKELADRVDGKVMQALALQDPDGAPLFSSIERVIVDQVQKMPTPLPGNDSTSH